MHMMEHYKGSICMQCMYRLLAAQNMRMIYFARHVIPETVRYNDGAFCGRGGSG